MEILSLDPNPHQVYYRDPYDLPIHSIIHTNTGNKIEHMWHVDRRGQYGNHLWGIKGYNGDLPIWECKDLAESLVKRGYWPPKYLIFGEMESDQ